MSERRNGTRRLDARGGRADDAARVLDEYWGDRSRRSSETQNERSRKSWDAAEPTAMVRELDDRERQPEPVWGFLVDPAKAERWMGQERTSTREPAASLAATWCRAMWRSGRSSRSSRHAGSSSRGGGSREGRGRAATPAPGGSTIEIELEPSGEGTSLRFTHRDLTTRGGRCARDAAGTTTSRGSSRRRRRRSRPRPGSTARCRSGSLGMRRNRARAPIRRSRVQVRGTRRADRQATRAGIMSVCGSSSSRATSPSRRSTRSSTPRTRRSSAAAASTARSTGAGGPAILAECRELRATRYPDGLPAGDAVSTTAGDLPARWVIHTVGPVYDAGRDQSATLRSCYARSLALANELDAATVAFPLDLGRRVRLAARRRAPAGVHGDARDGHDGRGGAARALRRGRVRRRAARARRLRLSRLRAHRPDGDEPADQRDRDDDPGDPSEACSSTSRRRSRRRSARSGRGARRCRR